MEAKRTIRLLANTVIDRIAAGEVVAQPSSVVKELVENAIDAKADQIEILIESGGEKSLEIRDNGVGIPYDELPLAVQRHATSKITTDSDLDYVTSLGFRGEALPSIAAVSRLRLESKVGSEKLGGVIEIHGGEQRAYEHVGVPNGTCVQVKDLFYAVPARRKFLKSPGYEWQRIFRVVKRLALAHAKIAWRIVHNGKVHAVYAKAESKEQRIQDVLGDGWASSAERVWEQQDEGTLEIFFSRPDFTFPNSLNQHFFVNGRPIVDRNLSHAVLQAYHTLIMDRRYPGVVLFLEMPASRFDVNVHPAKEEVRFSDSRQLHRWVVGLLRGHLIRRKVSVVSGYSPQPLVAQHAGTTYPSVPVANSYAKERSTTIFQSELPLESSPVTKASETQAFSSLKVLGQLMGSYILCEGKAGLVVIDQHAAHERVLYEQLKTQHASATKDTSGTQHLLEPMVFAATLLEQQTLETYRTFLDDLGLEIEPFGNNEFLIRSVPEFVRGDAKRFLHDVLEDLAGTGSSITASDIRGRTLESMACHSAIRFGDKLAFSEMTALLNSLDEIPAATNCPHGRPIMQLFSEHYLARLFKRT